MVHQAIKCGRARGVFIQVGTQVLHDKIRGHDDAAVRFIALMDQGLKQGGGGMVRERREIDSPIEGDRSR